VSNDDLIDALKALGHPLRLRIIGALATGERNVGEIEEVTGITQPTLSQQLGVIRAAGLVETRKAAKLVFYRLDADALGAIADYVGDLVGHQSGKGPVEPATRKPASGAANFARLA
jgi:DNA-binding transcriptional ArsR family regulator